MFFLFDVFKHLLSGKTDVLKTCRKSKLLGKKIWRNALALKGKKVQGIFGKTFYVALLSSAVFRQQDCLRFFLNCFFREIKGFYQSSLGDEVDFREIMIPGFVDERALITTTLISSCHCKTILYLFACERKDLKTHF